MHVWQRIISSMQAWQLVVEPHLVRDKNCEDLRQKVGLKVSVCIP